MTEQEGPITLKKERAKWLSLMSVTTFVAFFLGLYFSAIFQIGGPALTNDPQLARLIEAYQLLKDEWYFGTEITDLEEDLVNRAINGMAAYEIDPFTRFVLPENSGSGTTGTGMGVRISNYGQYFIIQDVFNNSPAAQAGLQSGDVLIAINNQTLAEASWDTLTTLVSQSDTLTVTYLRNGVQSNVSLTKATYTATTAFGTDLGQGVGWLRITNFDTYTPNEAETILNQFVANDIQHLVIDLRDNGGGSLDSLIRLADFFLPTGNIILEIREKGETVGDFERARTAQKYAFDTLIILINGNSASASEVFAAALNDNLDVNTTFTAGTKSYGKGTAQQVVTLNDGSTLRVTYAKWYTPAGSSVHGNGITPEFVVDEVGIYQWNLDSDQGKSDWLTALGYTGDLITQLSAFQQARGIPVTGIYDAATSFEVGKVNYDHRILGRLDQLWDAVEELTEVTRS